MNVYVVTAGCYSDFHIVAIFSDEAKAEEFKEDAHLDSCEVHEYVVDSAVPMIGMQSWRVEMSWNGEQSEVFPGGYSYKLENDIYEFDNESMRQQAHMISQPNYIYSGIRGDSVWARDVRHALKIVNEYRIRILMEKESKGDQKPQGQGNPQ